MKLLLLNGHGINLRVDNAKLHITDGKYEDGAEPEKYVFSPKRIDVDHVIIYGRNGNITFDAIRWLIKHNVQITFLDWDGKLLTTMLPPESAQVKTKFAQYQAFGKPEDRLRLARTFLEGKFARTQQNLNYLKERYLEVDTNLAKEVAFFRKTKTIPEMMMVEGRIASVYWQQIAKALPAKAEFETREYQKRPRGAGDTVNCMLNYGYAILEAECLKAINTAGLDTHVGFLHEMCMGKNSLAYDLQEPFRFLVDLAVLSAIEQGIMQKSDFIRSETYTLRLKPSGAKKLINEIDKQLGRKITFRGQQWSWRYVLQAKTQELAQYLQGKRELPTFLDPPEERKRQDTDLLRKVIGDISYEEWRKRGFSKGSLHYLKKNAEGHKPFTVNKHVEERLLTWR